jgi:predicted NBD/HSP70 family sugar kinase/biotin operon repressor
MEFAKDSNHSLILDMVRKKSPISRVQLAKEFGLSKVTVSAIINDLIDEGLIIEVGAGAGCEKGGRKPILLALNASSKYAIGVDIGSTNTVAAIGNLRGEVVAKTQQPTKKNRSFKSVFKQVSQLTAEIIQSAHIDRDSILGVGVSVPGLVAAEMGVVCLSPDLNWENVEINQILSELIGLPVVSDNCTRAMLLGAKWHGKAKDARNVFYVNIGYGIGSALMVNNQIYFNHSEFGHIHVCDEQVPCDCGKFGCLEAVASGNAIELAANNTIHQKEKNEGWVTVKALAKKAKHGDSQAKEIFIEAGQYLGRAIAIASNMFNPDKIILGGGVTLAIDLLQDALHNEYEKYAMNVIKSSTVIEVSPLGMDAGAYGAIALALNKFLYKAEMGKEQ